ncbi:hypothetical protein BD779DRAFT_1439358 [Infundibulicybe gibba]|nr:hypothetical protein BD779DRAFT_1439358 [Infundibulicybe gibba]
MNESYEIYVAHYGHPCLPGAKHWAIVVMIEPHQYRGVAYQISGSTKTYAVKEPEKIKVDGSRTYLGRVKVGRVQKEWVAGTGRNSLPTILQETPVVTGNLGWNCQNWVIAGLQRLREAGHDIKQFSLQDLQVALSTAQRDNYI